MTEVIGIGDTQLLSALRSSDGLDSLEQVYRDHAGALISLVTHCTGDSSLAYQFVEDVFVHLWDQPESCDPPQGSLRSCLAEDAYWRCKAGGALAPGMAERDRESPRSPWGLLSREERLAIALVCFGGMSSRRVASVLGVTQETVNSAIFEGLQRLARAS